jgi:hypothetical protein
MKRYKKLLEFNYRFFPLYYLYILFFSIYQCRSYLGFLDIKIFLWFELSIFYYIASGIFVNYYLKSSKKRISLIYKILSLTNVLILFVVFFIGLSLVFLDLYHSPNYIYNIINLQPKNLYWVLFVSLFYLVLRKTEKLSFDSFKKNIIYSLFVWILVCNGRFVISEISKNIFYVVKHPFVSYDEKMVANWGDFYNYILFIRNNIPSEATVAIPPPISPWNNEGSGPVFTGFLYPRQFSQNQQDSNFVDLKSDYALIAWGSYDCSNNVSNDKCHGWPKIKIPAEWIIYKKPQSPEVIEKIKKTIYDPSDKRNNNAWGIIKIKK